jgi:zinc transport system substrate-binding protein
LGLSILLAGCGGVAIEQPSNGRLPVVAGIPPLAYLVEQIGAEHVEVEVLVQPGQDPHTFEPTPQQIVALSRAAIFFRIGMPFETVLLEKVREGNPRLEVVDATRGVEKRPMDAAGCVEAGEERHEPATAHGEPDPHVWLSPPLLKIQAKNIAAALGQADPPHRRDYERNLAALVERLDALHRRIQRMLAPYRGRSFYVFHPGFGYFAHAYGLRQEAVEAGGHSPTPSQLRALIERARADGAKTIFVQPQYAPQSAQVVAEAIGGRVVVINGLAKDVLADLEDIATKVETAMGGKKGEGGKGKAEGGKGAGEQKGIPCFVLSFRLPPSAFPLCLSAFRLPPSPFLQGVMPC